MTSPRYRIVPDATAIGMQAELFGLDGQQKDKLALLVQMQAERDRDLEDFLSRVGGGNVEGGTIVSYDPGTGIAVVLLDNGETVEVVLVAVGGGGAAEFPLTFDTGTVTHKVDAPMPSAGPTSFGDALAVTSTDNADPMCFSALVTQAAATVGSLDLYANSATHESRIEMFAGPTRSRIVINMDGTEAMRFERTAGAPLIGFYGHAAVAQAAHPTTLADVINLLTNIGICA